MLHKPSCVHIRKAQAHVSFCEKRIRPPSFALLPPPACVGGRVGAGECELDPALISQAANSHCSLDTKHNFSLLGINPAILHTTRLLCSGV